MATIDRQLAIFDESGRLAFSPALRDTFAMKCGSTYEVTVEKEQIYLRPIQQKDRSKFDETGINKLRDMLRGGPSLEDEFLAVRRTEEIYRLQKREEQQ